MARTINSPGVQITEKDLYLRIETPVGTNILVTGFASQGPNSEPLNVTTVSEFEAIYGTPTTAAERYFYYSCREILNSPGILTTIRLPYGEGTGASFSNAYSGLFYPATSSVLVTDSLSSTKFEIGAPTHVSLSKEQYTKIAEGNFEWTGFGGSAYNSGTNEVNAGFFILNDLQVVNNEISEGYYVGLADNSAVAVSSPNFDSISEMVGLTAQNAFATIESTRLDFSLSATAEDSLRGITSVSESLEKVGFIGFENSDYQDHLSLGVFRIRRSTSDASLLTLTTSESYLGSLDSTRKQVSPSGGILSNAFIEDRINEGSPTIKLYINPAISKDFNWTQGTTSPTSRVSVSSDAKSLFPIGVFTPDARATETSKIIGNVPLKLSKALRPLESVENTTVDVIIDGGLSTIFSMTEEGNSDSFNDELFIDDVSNLTENWRAVTNMLVDFSQNVRKDCFTIIDPPRPIFVSGKDSKVIDAEGRTFTQDIYSPLKEVASFETNYAAIYGNWVKASDLFTNRRFWLPFSGYAGAIFARNDSVAQPWFAPAGLNRGLFTVLDIAFNPNQKQRDRLYEISVNPVVFFSGDGFVVMGQKTLQTKPTAFDRINVRRLFLTLERAVSRTVKYFVFEPNTDFTRNRIVNTITPIFELAKDTDGLYDFLIVADDRNNTSDVIDNNELRVSVYVKPVRTAEFVLVDFIATRTGQNFQELI